MLLAFAGAFAAPAASLASCVLPNYGVHMTDPNSVIVAGTVLQVAPQQVTVAVQRWWGAGAASSVVIQRPPSDPNVITSADWNPQPGEAYIILARHEAGGLSTGICAQLPGTADLAQEVETALGAGIVPGSTGEAPTDQVEPLGAGLLPIAFVGLAVLAAIAATIAILRLRRTR
jgi:hypothetical protein